MEPINDPVPLSRRSLLVKGSAATALVWSAPAVLSISSAHAQAVGSPPPGPVDPPPAQPTIPETVVSTTEQVVENPAGAPGAATDAVQTITGQAGPTGPIGLPPAVGGLRP